MLNTGAQAIVWTESSPAYRTVEDRSFTLADIREIKDWHEREVDLFRIRNYSDNWDGFESDAPDPKVVDCAISFLRRIRGIEGMEAPSKVALSPSGSVALVWVEGDIFLRAEISEPNEIDWMQATPGKNTEFVTESLPMPLDAEILRRQEWKPTQAAPSGFDKDRGQEWRPAPTVVDEPDYVSAR